MVAKDERGRSDEEVPSRVNPLQLLNALSAGGNSKGLSFVQVEMIGNGAKAMLDTGATHNFVDEKWWLSLHFKAFGYTTLIAPRTIFLPFLKNTYTLSLHL